MDHKPYPVEGAPGFSYIWRWSRQVTPNDYWTAGDCQRCLDLVEKVGK